MVVKKKTEAVLKGIGVFLAANAFVFGGVFILRWVFHSSIGQWLELNKPTKPRLPGSIFVIPIAAALIIAFFYYRSKVRGDQVNKNGAPTEGRPYK